MPTAHSAFHGCSWIGSSDGALVLHFENQHIQALQPSMEALQQKVGGLKSQDILLMSVYNESIAIATRKDAPVASYSIDRRCMMNYVRALVSEDTCALICFSCARRFPYVPHTKHIKIKNVKLLEKLAQDEVENSTFCGLSWKQTEQIFVLSTYVEKYGQMSEDVRLDEGHDEFDDWRMEVPFDNTTVRILCCPEDV